MCKLGRNTRFSLLFSLYTTALIHFWHNNGHFGVIATSINCSTIVDCRTCTLSTDFLIPCQWCLSSRSCVSAWSVGAHCTESDRIAHGYNCPLSPPTRFGYLDDFARTRALPFIAAASADSEHQIISCLDNNVPNTSFLRRYSIACDFVKSNCAAFLAYSPLDNAIVVTFRGTNGAVQVFVEAINFMLYAQKDFEPVGGKVVAYFYDAFFQLWKGGLEADLRETIARHTTAELWIFGHSLGGAIGALAAAWVSRLGLVPMEQIRFISFGQPRTGNLAFAQIFDDLVPYKYRIVHRGDCITKLPARIPISDSSLFHHRYEVWYNNDMQAGEAYEMCESADSASCSASVTDAETLSSANHLQYFNVSLYSWFRSGCASKMHLKLRPHLPLFHHNHHHHQQHHHEYHANSYQPGHNFANENAFAPAKFSESHYQQSSIMPSLASLSSTLSLTDNPFIRFPLSLSDSTSPLRASKRLYDDISIANHDKNVDSVEKLLENEFSDGLKSQNLNF